MSKGISRRGFINAGARTTAALGLVGAMWQQQGQTARASSDGAAGDSYRISPDLHLLNRTSFGARPDDLARVARRGRAAFIEEQLNPATIDDRDCERRVLMLPSLLMNNAALRYVYRFYSKDPKYTPLRCAIELWQATILRAVYSQRQLYEVMVDFWTNHFNISQQKDDCLWYKTSDDRRVIRAHALGKFRDLLIASAHSPAMLYYLDNAYSSGDNLNENYGREIMELHTLGVEGGYSQQDVRNVARAFSGWSIDHAQGLFKYPSFEFQYHDTDHDKGLKVVLGHILAAGRGIEDGDDVLNILARHPSTARHIATKLCRYFIADNPPASIVNAVTNTFIATDGDIKAMLRQILLSPEFAASAGQKMRSPFRYVAASIRALGGETKAGDLMVYSLDKLGQPLFGYNFPTGYPDAASFWITTDGLLGRWKFGTGLVFGVLKDTTVPVQAWVDKWQPHDALDLVQRFAALLLNGNLAPAHARRLATIVGDDRRQWDKRVPFAVAVMLAAPQFQLM